GSANFGTGAVTFNGGTFQTNAGNQTFSNALNLSGPVNFTNANVVFTGPTALTANTYVIQNNNVFFNGVVSGPGALVIAQSTATVILNNANTYTGGTVLTTGNLQISNNNALGTGLFTIVGGTINPSFSNGDNVAAVVPNNILLPTGAFTINQ